MTRLIHEELTRSIIGEFFDVRRELDYGYREHIYSRALEVALIAKGHKVAREVPVMVYFRGKRQRRSRLVSSCTTPSIPNSTAWFARIGSNRTALLHSCP